MSANYGKDKWPHSKQRLDAEFAAFNAVKTIIELATEKDVEASNNAIMRIASKVSTEIFNKESQLYQRHFESELVREYRQRAALETIESQKEVKASDLAKADVDKYLKLLEVASDETDVDAISNKIKRLNEAIPKLLEKAESENEWILRDIEIPKEIEEGIPVPPISDGRCKVFQHNDTILKIRRLHPDNPEKLTGADLIYERYDLEKKLVRFVHIQYKIWDEKGVLYFSQGNIVDQIEKMTSNLCKGNYCESPGSTAQSYRLPFCSGFLRPTNRVQDPGKRIHSRGLYIPLCMVISRLEKISSSDGILKKTNIANCALNQSLFERLFHDDMLGSKWYTYEEVEQFYKSKGILDSNEKLIYHAQEFNLE